MAKPLRFDGSEPECFGCCDLMSMEEYKAKCEKCPYREDCERWSNILSGSMMLNFDDDYTEEDDEWWDWDDEI
ncbi:MAG: hypothetical protein DRP01_01540 [Archaeoglobales archaeon]|nr:MAG: hypothetical protein DRP01_01540 [Archaeoglobales archaeon]